MRNGSSEAATGSRAIEARLRALAGELPAGSRLPSTRALVGEHAASPLTVAAVVRRLTAEGLVETRPGAGTFVAARHARGRADHSWQTTALGPARTDAEAVGTAMAATPPGALALHSGYPVAELLPVQLVRASLARAARTPLGLDRAPVAGLADLRAWFATDTAPPSATAPAHPDDVVITPGGQSALSSVFRALAAPGDPVVVESPTYWGALAAARQAGLRVVPVARDAHAPRPQDLDDVLASSGARLVYAQPHFANPTGALWTAPERAALLDVVRARGAYLVEDDWAHDFGIDADAVPLFGDDPDGHVVTVRSLTKSVAPSVRVGAVLARGPALARVQADRTVDDLYVSGLLQVAALEVLTHPSWRRHGRWLRGALRARRDELARQVVAHLGAEALPHLPAGGLNLWVRLPDRTDVGALVRRSREAGVLVAPGDDWFPAEAPGAHLRLNYTGAPPERFAEGVATLAGLVG